MKAVVSKGTRQVAVEEVPDARVEEGKGAAVGYANFDQRLDG